MKRYKIIILTDHSSHNKENSLYPLATTLSKHQQCQSLMVASRGNIRNLAFFRYMESNLLYAINVTSTFSFQEHTQQFDKNATLVSINDFDVIFLRLPRPLSDNFLQHLISIAPNKIFINHPKGIIETSNKSFLTINPIHNVCPPIKYCTSAIDIMLFASQFPIVLKPLKNYGGKGIVKIVGRKVYYEDRVENLKEYLSEHKNTIEQEGMLAMKFLNNVSKGDKRILVVNGKILAASLRLPPPNSWLCNVAQGGISISAEITLKEKKMIEIITPILSAKGIVFFGIDTLENDNGERMLSEINTLSIGGFPQAEKQTGKPIVQIAINEMITYINKQYSHANTSNS